jgi:hypothetical protein
MPIKANDRDLPKGIRLDVQVHRPRAEPFIESPLIASVQMVSEISRILLRSMDLRLIQRDIIDGLPGWPYAGDGV